MNRLVRILRRPLNALYWLVMAFLCISILAGLFSPRHSAILARMADPSAPRINPLEAARAGFTCDEIQRAVASPTESVLPSQAVNISIEDIPLMLRNARNRNRPCLCYFYCSLREPVFGPEDHSRLFETNPGALFALALSKALDPWQNRPPFDLYACRVNKIGPMTPETLRQLQELGVCGKCSLTFLAAGFFTFINARGSTQDTYMVEFAPEPIARYATSLREWIHTQIAAAGTNANSPLKKSQFHAAA